MLVVCGPSCAGKSTFGEVARRAGLSVVEGSAAVKDIFVANQTAGEDTIAFCRRWYSEQGRDVFARENHRRMAAQELSLESVVLIGCRTIEEVEYLRSLTSKCRVIGLYADASVRFARSVARKRADLAVTFEQFVTRDMRELDLGIASIMAYTIDRLIITGGQSLSEFERVAQQEIRTCFHELDIAEDSTSS